MKSAAPQTAQIAGSRRVLITVSVMLASVMSSLDTTIANVALPRMQGSVSASQDQMAWVLTSYIVAAAIMTPLSGWLAGQMIMHATLGEHVTRYSPVLRAQLPHGPPSLRILAGLNAIVTEQAAMIAYNNDFKLMMVLSLAAIPLLFLMRKTMGSAEPVHVE